MGGDVRELLQFGVGAAQLLRLAREQFLALLGVRQLVGEPLRMSSTAPATAWTSDGPSISIRRSKVPELTASEAARSRFSGTPTTRWSSTLSATIVSTRTASRMPTTQSRVVRAASRSARARSRASARCFCCAVYARRRPSNSVLLLWSCAVVPERLGPLSRTAAISGSALFCRHRPAAASTASRSARSRSSSPTSFRACASRSPSALLPLR